LRLVTTSVNAKDEVLNTVSRLSLFEGLDDQTLRHIALSAELRTLEKEEWVIHKGERGAHLYFLLIGRLQVIDSTEEGREIGISFLKPGDYFGELSVIDGLPRSASVVATSKSKLLALRRSVALDLFHNQPLVVERVLKKLANTVRHSAFLRVILAMPSVNQRVCAMLDHLTVIAPGGLPVINNVPTQQQLAIMINTSRETVSRSMKLLVDRGVIERDYQRLIVRRPEELRRASKLGKFDEDAE
jgi:CRP/FNR family cyclic AMP-dependent transcriptional regulator